MDAGTTRGDQVIFSPQTLPGFLPAAEGSPCWCSLSLRGTRSIGRALRVRVAGVARAGRLVVRAGRAARHSASGESALARLADVAMRTVVLHFAHGRRHRAQVLLRVLGFPRAGFDHAVLRRLALDLAHLSIVALGPPLAALAG